VGIRMEDQRRRNHRSKTGLELPYRAEAPRNPDITDIVYLSFRRSRTDYNPSRSSLFNNSGFEYTFDMTENPVLHPPLFHHGQKVALREQKMASPCRGVRVGVVQKVHRPSRRQGERRLPDYSSAEYRVLTRMTEGTRKREEEEGSTLSFILRPPFYLPSSVFTLQSRSHLC